MSAKYHSISQLVVIDCFIICLVSLIPVESEIHGLLYVKVCFYSYLQKVSSIFKVLNIEFPVGNIGEKRLKGDI